MELIEPIGKRVSITHFASDPIDPDVLRRILEAGRHAPSAKNRQPWRFIVVQDEQSRTKIESAAFGQEHVGQAPAIIAACTTNIDYVMPNGQPAYPIDISFAVAFMMIQAEAEGVGSCVVTTYSENELKEILSIPFSMRVVMLLLLGRPAERPLPTERKSFELVVGFNHW